ncbi:hypothetical protein [Paraburkholderia sp. BL10I2N1]|uniref:hypothetical protein n=1 Tax=Paraburkholderia sp. BL10I2N1 TaxID=1938796 RepID=UPI001060BB79|nr:hypothetical protein [Paraburkholderia sp. BL10I2N1]TDN70463.1 hypothetical protein B0G77_3937 [Paraburkholderia sp. BL10I2N1]
MEWTLDVTDYDLRDGNGTLLAFTYTPAGQTTRSFALCGPYSDGHGFATEAEAREACLASLVAARMEA